MDRICLRCADAALLEPLEEAARELGLPLDMDGRPVWLEPGGEGLRIDPRGDAVQVCYGTRAAAFRALSLLPETLERQDVFLQSPRFTLNGVLVDASRNAVPKPETLYQLIRRCAAMGLNALFLYTGGLYGSGNPEAGRLRRPIRSRADPLHTDLGTFYRPHAVAGLRRAAGYRGYPAVG